MKRSCSLFHVGDGLSFSDSARYGGGNLGNEGGVMADGVPMHGFSHSVSLMVPPLGFVLLKRE